ncbi:MAG: S8 family serine peptidase [Candidatus Magasanikbacteria bacterium]|nr:S8 family serine peptidase [Candidatus Magasanikbacteria bacterium]
MSKLYSIVAEKATSGLIGLLLIIFILPRPVLARVPDDPRYSDQEKMWNQINAPAAWDYGTGSRRVVVAVIDTGVDTWHDDLRGNIWANPGEIPDNGLDDDRNGYVDDVNGWNFVENNNNVRTSVFDVKDDPEAVRHGTIIAGLIGALGDNSRDGAGLNWRVRIMPLRAIDSSGSGSFRQVTAAVEYAVANGANVISMSFIGEDPVGALREALRRAYEKGVVIVTAAGNHGREVSGDLDTAPLYPACFDSGDSVNWLLTVASVDASDHLSRFSDYGRCVDIAAPGEGVFSTERYAPQFGYNYEFGGEWRGTSFAVPLVAGAAALLKSLHPDWQPSAIISTLLDAADKIDSANPGYLGKIGVGRLNVGRALASANQAESPERTLDGALYYYDAHALWRRSVKNGTVDLMAAVSDGEIVSAGEAQSQGGTEKRAVILFKRGRAFIVRQLSEKGAIIARDFVLPAAPRRLTKSLRAFVAEEGIFPVVEQFDTRSRKTIFIEFNGAGKKLKEVSVAAVVSDWRVSAESRAVVAMVARRGVAVINQLPFDDQGEALQASIPGVQVVVASAIGHFWPGSGEELAMVVRDNSAVSLVVLDLPSGSYRFDEIQDSAARSPWKVVAVTSAGGARPSLLPFQPEGGVFGVFNESGALLPSVAVPKIDGKID